MSLESAIPNVVAADAASLSAATAMQNDAFAAFYERSARPLWAYLARVSGDAALADDLLQESYIRFLCADLREDGEVAARRYLFRIATNLMRDHWRRPRASSIEELPEEHFGTSGHQASQVESSMILSPALQKMRPRERQLLWLAYAEGYSHREIAEVMGLAAISIRPLLFRARQKIARIITKQAARRPQ
jgi:RNA polymerase sigma-70 factor, ECF subfamily